MVGLSVAQVGLTDFVLPDCSDSTDFVWEPAVEFVRVGILVQAVIVLVVVIAVRLVVIAAGEVDHLSEKFDLVSVAYFDYTGNP